MFIKQWLQDRKQRHEAKLANAEREAKADSLSMDILDLSKIKAGKLELKPVKYEIASLINDTVRLNLVRFENKPVVLKLQVDENIPSALFGDELRIKQVLNNLISNASKFTERGRVTLLVSSEQAGGNGITLLIKVRDTGRGMNDEQLGRLFEMNLTWKLIQIMNGTISVESISGMGTEFAVRLPQGTTGSGILGREAARNLRQFRLVRDKNFSYETSAKQQNHHDRGEDPVSA